MVWAGLETMPGGSKAVGTANERELEGYMTSEDALQEARRRWGKRAAAEHVLDSSHWKYHWKYRVYANDGSFKWGIGDSWEAAFADADRKENAK